MKKVILRIYIKIILGFLKFKQFRKHQSTEPQAYCQFTIEKLFDQYILRGFLEGYRHCLPDCSRRDMPYYHPTHLTQLTRTDLFALLELHLHVIKSYRRTRNKKDLECDIDYQLCLMFEDRIKKEISK